MPFSNNKQALQYHIKRRREQKLRAIALLGGRCADCGLETNHIEVYDFDHRYGEIKEFSIAHRLASSWEKLLPELAKCDLVCANCHRTRTVVRRQ